MTELDGFERQLVGSLRAYAEAMPVVVDPFAVADRVAGERRQRWIRSRDSLLVDHRRLVWLVVALLVIALTGGVLAVGVKLRERPPAPISAGSLSIDLVAPAANADSPLVAGTHGDVWAVTLGRLVRLDSATGRTETWDISDGAAFADPHLVLASDGGVWLSGAHTLRHFDGSTLGPVLTPPMASSVVSVASGPSGILVVADEAGGVWRWDGDQWTPIRRDGQAGVAIALAVDVAGDVWAADATYPGPMPGGLERFDGSRWVTIQDTGDGGSLAEIETLAASPDGGVWAGALTGLQRCVGDRCSIALDAAGTWAAAVGPDGTAWASTRWSASPIRLVRIPRSGPVADVPTSGLPEATDAASGSVTLAVADDAVIANTWSGLYRLGSDRWERIWPAAEPTTLRVFDVAAVSRDEAWVLGGYGADGSVPIMRADGDGVEPAMTGLTDPDVRGIAVGPDGTPWIVGPFGVATWSDGRWTVVDPEWAFGVAVGADDVVWVFDRDEVRSVVHTASGFTTISRSAGPPMGAESAYARIEAVADHAGRLWTTGPVIGYGNRPGLDRRVDGRWEAMTPVPDSEHMTFSGLQVAPDGAVWVAMTGRGEWTSRSESCCVPDPAAQVARYLDGTWTVFGTADGLPRDDAGPDLAITPDGTAWLSTGSGLYRFADDRWTLAYPDYGFGRLSAAPDGTIWATGASGLLRITVTDR